MNDEASIVKKTEFAIDDLKDLWRRRKVVCLLVLAVIVLPTGFTLYQQLVSIPRLQSDVDAKQAHIDDLTRERDKLDIKLASFQAAADKAFPDRERNERLDLLLKRLSEQIDSITKWTTTFKPLDQDQAIRFVSSVKALAATSSNATIRVQCETGSSARRQYGQQLGEMLSAAGMGHFTGGTFVGFAPEGQMVCLYPANHESLVREFFKLLGSWTEGQVTMRPMTTHGSMITIHINGEPSFDTSGRVKMM